MKKSLKFASFALLLLMAFLPTRSAAAASGAFDGQVILGQSFVLESGDTLLGDLLVLGGSAEIETGAVVNGNIVLFGGDLVIDGEVTGTVSATGANVSLGPDAYIRGDLITVAATLDKADTARVGGQIYNTATSWADGNNSEPPVVPVPDVPRVNIPDVLFNFNPLGGFLDVFGNALAMGLLAMLLGLFLAPHAGRVARAVVDQPLIAGGIGLLALILTPIALVMMVLTLILIPVAVIVVFALIIAGVFGWIAIGMEIGQRFTRAIHQEWHPSLEAGLGTFTLTLIAAALLQIPVLNCLGGLLPILLGLAALGAVIMTRFGTQAVLPPASRAAVAPAAEPAVLPPVPPEQPKNRKKSG